MDIGKLKSIRAGHRAGTARILRKLEEATENSEINYEGISLLIDLLPQKQRTLCNLNEKIIEATSEDSMEEEIIETDEYHLMLDTKVNHYRKICQQYSSIPRNSSVNLQNTGADAASNMYATQIAPSFSSVSSTNSRLP